MERPTFLRKQFKFVWLILLVIFLILAFSYASRKWTYFLRQATIEGYVFVDKRLHGKASGNVQIEMMARSVFFENILKNYKNTQPLENATVSLGPTGIISHTEKTGYFQNIFEE